APLELYPSLAYLVTGQLAALFGLDHDLPLALMIVAVIVYLTIAAATTAVALRVAPAPIALVIGVLTLVDSGAVAHGGTVGLFHWALLHSAMALACSVIAAVGVLEALARPRLGASLAIWLATAAAAIAHPAGLISAAAAVAGLGAVALLASDVPARRALIAMLHVVLGVALGACVWMPLAARILAYGQHFPNPLHPPARLLEDLLMFPSPVSAFAAFEYAGYFGILVALWSRRARLVFVAAVAFVLLLGLCDAPYLALDLAPGLGVARLGTERLAQLARPFVWGAAAYGLAILWGHARTAWRGASRQRQWIAAAVFGIVGGATVRQLPAVWNSMSDRAANEARVYAPDAFGRAELTRWAAAQVQGIGPASWARAMFEEDTHEHFHLTAETGLPTFHLAPQPDLLLRERIEDASEASLRRFNVRWVVGVDRSPVLGDPATEKTLGSYHIRELPGWDGKFARIERGAGEVVVTRLDDRAVVVEVRAGAPVLVALGTGFYPRWQARHASGAAEPVYAYPTIPGGRLHVVAAWLAPGVTTFTCDGPLPSDHGGRAISILAALAIAGGALGWRRWRWRALRWAARRRPGLASRAIRIAVPAVLVVLVIRGCRDNARETRAIELGSGLRPSAQVEARLIGDTAWQTCSYSRLTGSHDCDGLVIASDGTASLLNDAVPSWAFVTPAITASAYTSGVELRVTLQARLAGVYDAAVSDGKVAMTVDQTAPPSGGAAGRGQAPAGEGDPASVFDRAQLTYDDHGERTVIITSPVPLAPWAF
ncbi:MAG TPA: hypothetical protein VGC42_01985, partial [Kofleriaceae bacterium]